MLNPRVQSVQTEGINIGRKKNPDWLMRRPDVTSNVSTGDVTSTAGMRASDTDMLLQIYHTLFHTSVQVHSNEDGK